jgi:hypothetical protein
LPDPDRQDAGRGCGDPLPVIVVFSAGNEFNTIAEPGFFVPALRWPFMKRVISVQKRAAWMI